MLITSFYESRERKTYYTWRECLPLPGIFKYFIRMRTESGQAKSPANHCEVKRKVHSSYTRFLKNPINYPQLSGMQRITCFN